MRTKEGVGWICNKRARGASFCQVDKMRPVVRSRPCITSGSQVCKGAKPIFMPRARVIIVAVRGCDTSSMAHCPVSQALVVPAKRRTAAPVAWVRKYLVVASTARG